jgi:hypothetical protein
VFRECVCTAGLCEQVKQASTQAGRVLAGRTLQDFEVLDVGIFGVDVELDARHGHVKEDAVVHLAEGGAVGVGCF